MKKVPRTLLLLVVITTVVIPLIVQADSWQYYTEITVTDTSGTSRTNIPVIVPIRGQSLVSAGYVSSDARDTRIKEGTTERSFGIEANKTAFLIPSLGAEQQRIYKLYMGYSPAIASHSIILGESMAESIVESYDSNDDGAVRAYNTTWEAQTFTTTFGVAYSVTSIGLKLYRLGMPGSTVISIRATDSSGYPTGSDLTSATVNGSNFSANSSGIWYVTNVTPYTLSDNTRYAIVVRAVGGTVNENETRWRADGTAPTYGLGSWFYSTDSGTTWTENVTSDSMFRIYKSSTSYITIPDNATLEPSSNFSIEIKGYVNTTGGTGCFLLRKGDSTSLFNISVPSNGTIMASTAKRASPTNHSDPSNDWDNEVCAYDLSTSTYATYNTTGAYLYLNCNDSAMTCVGIRVYCGNSYDTPAGNIDIYDIANASWTNIHSGTFPSFAWTEDTFPAMITNSTRINFTGSTLTRLHELEFLRLNTVSATGIASDIHTINVVANGTNLSISIDNLTKDSIAWAGIGINDNNDNWTLAENNTLPCIEYFNYSVSGTPVLWYQPNAMISGFTLPDRSGKANNGTIHWGGNNGITVTIGSTTSYATSTAEGGKANETANTVLPADMPENWYTGNSSLSGLPYYARFLSASNEIGMPVRSLYAIVIVGLAIAIGLGVLLFTGSLTLAAIGTGLMLYAGVRADVLGGWIVFVFILYALCLMYLARRA